MSTVRVWMLSKKERTRLKETRARSKSGEETTCAPPHSAQGSHDRPTGNSTIASLSGRSRKVGALGEAKEMVRGHGAGAEVAATGATPNRSFGVTAPRDHAAIARINLGCGVCNPFSIRETVAGETPSSSAAFETEIEADSLYVRSALMSRVTLNVTSASSVVAPCGNYFLLRQA